MSLKSNVRLLGARVARPFLHALDLRLEQLAARLERHTSNLSIDQRAEVARIDDRLTLDVAVMSEHLVGIERLARSAVVGADRIVIALPGDELRIPSGVSVSEVVAYVPDEGGGWSRVAHADESTLRLMHVRQRSGA